MATLIYNSPFYNQSACLTVDSIVTCNWVTVNLIYFNLESHRQKSQILCFLAVIKKPRIVFDYQDGMGNTVYYCHHIIWLVLSWILPVSYSCRWSRVGRTLFLTHSKQEKNKLLTKGLTSCIVLQEYYKDSSHCRITQNQEHNITFFKVSQI